MRLQYLIFGIVIGFMVITLNSCKSNTSSHGYTDVETIKFEPAPESFLPGCRFKNVSFIQLEMTEESVLGPVRKIIPVEDRLIVLSEENSEVQSFDRETGKYLGRIGMIGEGPEEYLSVQAMTYDPKEKKIIIYDNAGKSFVAYRADGTRARCPPTS